MISNNNPKKIVILVEERIIRKTVSLLLAESQKGKIDLVLIQ